MVADQYDMTNYPTIEKRYINILSDDDNWISVLIYSNFQSHAI